MKKVTLICMSAAFQLITAQQFSYPPTKKVGVTDEIWGQKIQDDYRWMEDVKNPEMVSWLKSQADFTNSQLSKIPGQDQLIKELKQYEQMNPGLNIPAGKSGKRYFYNRKNAGEQVRKLYYRDGENGAEKLLFDPQKFIAGKTMDYNTQISDDGSRIIFNLSESGSELGDIHIMEVSTGKFLSDVIPHSEGYFFDTSKSEIIYRQFKSYDVHDPENNLNLPLKLHKIGTPISSDILLASAEKYPELGIKPMDYLGISSYKNSPYVFLGIFTVDPNAIFYYAPKSDFKNKKIVWKKLVDQRDEIHQMFVDGEDVYFQTPKGNSNFRLIKTSLKNPDIANAKVILDGNSNWKIDRVVQTKDFLVIDQDHNGIQTKIVTYNLRNGKEESLNANLEGNVMSMPFNENQDDNEIVLINTGWTKPFNVFPYDLAAKKKWENFLTVKFNFPNLENLTYEEIEYPSHDGTLVPLSIVYDKTKLKKDGSNTAFMMGYGSYGMIAYAPVFQRNYLPLLNRGVVIAFAHVRGGGEKGNDWYLAGKKTTKPNTWKDFNAAAEYLIKNKFTSPEKLGITGASAGGILIGRAITERPDLYKVAIPKVGCLNTLRMEFSANGPVNIPEFGTIKDETEFKALYEMDAFQHIKKGTKYPAQLITTGFNDPRVDSFIPAKFAAKMQDQNASQNPVYLYVDYKAGHFGGSTMDEQFAQLSKEFAFLLSETGNPEFQVK